MRIVIGSGAKRQSIEFATGPKLDMTPAQLQDVCQLMHNRTPRFRSGFRPA